MSSVLHVPSEGVADGYPPFEDTRDVLVGRLLVFDPLEGLTSCHKGSHDVGDYFHFVRCPFPMDCVQRLSLPFELKINRVY